MITVRLEGDTVGELLDGESLKIGDIVKVSLHDENGQTFTVQGILSNLA